MRKYFKQVIIVGPWSEGLEAFIEELRLYFGLHNKGNVKYIKKNINCIEIWFEVYSPKYYGKLISSELLVKIKKRRPSLDLLRTVFWSNYHKRYGKGKAGR